MNDFAAEIRKIPPVTRVVCLSSLGVSLGVMGGLVSAYKVIYTYQLAFERLEIWRLYTSFFLGSSGINYIFEFFTLYRTMDQLESGPYARKSADLAWQLFAASVAIMLTSLPVGSAVFFRPFLLCVAYLGSSLAPVGSMTSIMGLVQLPIKYLPYIMLGMDLIMGGPGAVAVALPGAVVGHLWWWGIWGPEVGGAGGILSEWGAAPRWLREWMQQPVAAPPGARRADGTTGANAGSGVHIIPPRRPLVTSSAPQAGASAPTTASTGSGYNWGGGHKLGRD
ncbi:Der1-like family-domain-containing protein [Mycena alexandri]|uniref:Derlin n=1 Tax=Mycena alexandri TaxID=1745969 RepID=A0AAD6SYC6_9AGAR|nr:Der1-like family-domain-containing protein [Mycena alexandri]